jgi:L-rhamnose mutarotase
MYVSIGKSTRAGKKMMAIFYDEAKKKIKTTHFGADGFQDYTQHGDLSRKMNYISRHKKNEDWNDYMSPGSLSLFILWNKPTISASIKDYMNKFKLKSL